MRALVARLGSGFWRRSQAVDEIERQLVAARESTDRWKNTAAQYRRQMLSAHVIEQVFEHRARTLPARVAIPSREQREAALNAASPAYVGSVEQVPQLADGHVHQMSLHGLRWWMPVVRPRPGGPRPAWIAKQKFPYKTLARTRELAIGGIMLDLGANVGLTSIPRVMLGDVAAAYCAEPDPLNYSCLVDNVVDNGLRGLVLPDRVAIADTNGSVRLRRAHVPGGHQVLVDGHLSAAPTDDIVDVPSLTLDTWLTGLRVDFDAVTFVKIDVQGFEMRVLQGAAALLARRQVAWQLEIYPALLTSAGSSLGDLCAKLHQHFIHFIDLNGDLTGPRERPTRELSEALAYVGVSRHKTDILVY